MTAAASRRVHAVRPGGQGRRRHHRAGGGPRPRRRPRHRVRRARDLRALPGDAERGPLRQVGDRRHARCARAAGDDRDRLPRQPAARRGQPPRLRRTDRGGRRRRRPRRQPGPPPGRAQGPRPGADRRRPDVPPLLRRRARRPARRGGERVAGAAGSRRRPARTRRPRWRRRGAAAVVAPAARRRAGPRDGGRARRRQPPGADRRRVARLRRRRPRHRRRRRLDDDRRPPVRPGHRRGAGLRRADEPADPLRRGPHEPGVVRDDEPRRRSPADGGGAPGARRARRRADRGGGQPARPRRSRSSSSATRSCTTSPSASTPRRSAARRFVLATDEAVTVPASELDLDLPHARAYAGPCIAGHVGADTAAAILAEGPHRGEAMQLLVDVGTNAEIVLGDRTRVFAASSPTGPAFEGAQISCGQRRRPGPSNRCASTPRRWNRRSG